VTVTFPHFAGSNSCTLSFASTLYTSPILDFLLAEVPPDLHSELRLGLQEALINAAKHGNKLDPNKQIIIHFFVVSEQYWWVVTDQGAEPKTIPEPQVPCHESDCGRGLYMLHQIFDQVHWNHFERQLHLCKQINEYNVPLIP